MVKNRNAVNMSYKWAKVAQQDKTYNIEKPPEGPWKVRLVLEFMSSVFYAVALPMLTRLKTALFLWLNTSLWSHHSEPRAEHSCATSSCIKS